VIREELAAGAGRERKKRRAGIGEAEGELDLEELCERAGISPDLARELESFGLIEGRNEGGERLFPESDAEIALACGNLARYGIAPRHLRAFRTAADREAGLLEALVAPALRSRNPERRRTGLADLQDMAESSQELQQLLFWRDLRRLASS
jgi:DNA-binding transcriptional MerR regulator